jgi:hypothetical protein
MSPVRSFAKLEQWMRRRLLSYYETLLGTTLLNAYIVPRAGPDLCPELGSSS